MKNDKIIYTIYLYRNKMNNKCYVGQTTQTVKKRAKREGKGYKSCIKFWYSIQKYGWDNFDCIILEQLECTAQDAESIETFYKFEFNCFGDFGYNIRIKDKHGPLTENHKQKISKAHIGKKFTQEHIKNLSGNNNYMFGKKITLQVRQKLSIANMGEKNPMFGKIRSKELRKKLSELNSGVNNPMYGKKHTIEAIIKMSKVQKGENNPLSKLNNNDVIEIRKLLTENKLSGAAIGRKYGVSTNTINRIKLNISWKDVQLA